MPALRVTVSKPRAITQDRQSPDPDFQIQRCSLASSAATASRADATAMSFMLSFSQDGRLHRDDDFPDRRATRTTPLDGNAHTAEMQTPEAMCQPPGPAGSRPALPRRQLVFPDPIAFRYLEEDPCVEVVQRRSVLRGYELYLVEQWACSRQSPTLVVATYTGDEKHSVVVGVLAVSADESLWSNQIRVYLKAAEQFCARPKDTKLGELMVTNLSSFPSSLTVIPVPDGDLRKHRQVFIVNEDLKRLGCSGRSGLTLTEPTEATQAKFHQLYRTSDRISFSQSVTELIKLCQVALYMFDKLDHEYIDGLLCDVTERAIANWWTDVGAEHYNYEPTDGVLGPSTVAALLGMLMGARHRLHCQGAPVSKDVFDIESTKRGISYFQKAHKLEKTRRLDQQTLFKLHTITTKAAAREGWGVQKAVKSTVTEIGGKRGEIVMDMVSGKDKGGLADIETVDMDRFISLAYGERPKWLWRGKPRRTLLDQNGRDQDMALGETEALGQAAKRTQSLPMEDELEAKRKEELLAPDSGVPLRAATSNAENFGDRDALRKTVFKSVAGKMSDARSGLGRIKDVVGARGRGHGSRLSMTTKEDVPGPENLNGVSSLLGVAASSIMAPAAPMVNKTFTWKNKPEEYLAAIKRGDGDVLPGLTEESRDTSSSTVDLRVTRTLSEDDRGSRDLGRTLENIGPELMRKDLPRRAPSAVPSAVASAVDESDMDVACPDVAQGLNTRRPVLSRRHSCGVSELWVKHVINESRWARRMSFGDAEEAVLAWEEIIDIMDIMDTGNDMEDAESRAMAAGCLAQYIDDVVYGIEPWVKEKINLVELLNQRYGRVKGDMQGIYHQLNEACQRVQYSSEETLTEERASLTESVKEIEVLVARLDYEIKALVQKVHDVEDGIHNFERQVQNVERRADELKTQLETESWLHWFVRTLTGVGTGPNITRSSVP